MTDPYVDPATGVLRNRLGIVDSALLSEAEAALSAAALADLAVRTLPGSYDLEHLRSFHREIFADVYPWAGEIRRVNIAKTDLFCVHQHIETYSHDVLSSLAKENFLRGLPRGAFIDRLAHYFAEINAIHPFREGNGRTQRAYFHQLCRMAGWPIDWTGLDAQANIDASVASLRGDNAPLRTLLDGMMER